MSGPPCPRGDRWLSRAPSPRFVVGNRQGPPGLSDQRGDRQPVSVRAADPNMGFRSWGNEAASVGDGATSFSRIGDSVALRVLRASHFLVRVLSYEQGRLLVAWQDS